MGFPASPAIQRPGLTQIGHPRADEPVDQAAEGEACPSAVPTTGRPSHLGGHDRPTTMAVPSSPLSQLSFLPVVTRSAGDPGTHSGAFQENPGKPQGNPSGENLRGKPLAPPSRGKPLAPPSPSGEPSGALWGETSGTALWPSGPLEEPSGALWPSAPSALWAREWVNLPPVPGRRIGLLTS